MTLTKEAPSETFEAVREQLIFRAGDLLLALSVLQVREILEVERFSPIPYAPVHVLGMIDLRGESVATIDIAAKLGMPKSSLHEDSRVVVLDVLRDNKLSALAILTDGVLGVDVLDEARSEDLPTLGEDWLVDAIDGVGRVRDSVVLTLNLSAVFDAEDLRFE